MVAIATVGALMPTLGLAVAPSAGAGPLKNPPPKGSSNGVIKELQTKRDQVRSIKAKTAAQVDALKATDAEVTAALADLSNNITGQAALLEEAKRGVTQAEAEEAASLAAEDAAANELGDIRVSIKAHAVEAYVSSPPDDALAFLSAASITDAVNRKTLLEVQTAKNLDSAERYRSVQEDLAIARAASTAAHRRAEQHRSDVTDRLAKLEAAEAAQEKFADQIDARMDRALAEADALAELDGALSADINTKQAQLAAQLAAQRAAASRRFSSVGGAARRDPGSGRPVPSLPTSGGNGIATVGGIRVDSSIAGNLERLLAAASAAGVNFGGGGFRDPAGQIAVRRNNCGSSDYAVYQAPASSCRPPTARPGQSMHEQGLAIDFTEGGRTLSRGSAGYSWLAANGAGFGFYNLPSEPWHWSTNGN